YQYSNAKGSDLWRSIEEASGMPVSRIMEAWVKRKGYPVVVAEKSGRSIKLHQKQFLLAGAQESEPWPIPLTVRYRNETKSILFDRKQMEIPFEGFLKINVDSAGFYRVKYDDALWNTILSNATAMTFLDKWGVVSDLFAFLKSGEITKDQYFQKISTFFSEEEPIIVSTISDELFELHLVFPEEVRIRSTALSYYREKLNRLGSPKKDEPEEVSILRGDLYTYLAVLDDGFSKKLSADFGNYFRYDPNLRLGLAVAEARTNRNIDTLLAAYRKSENDNDRIKLINAMAWLTEKPDFENIYSMFLNDKFKKQELARVLMYLAMNPAHRETLIGKLEESVNKLDKYFKGTAYTGMALEQMIPLIGLADERRLLEMIGRIRNPSNEKGIDKGLELLSIYKNIR
ncbi:MAG TPA: ERAP1-like C-terminal domain-containing protein, partial [Thermoplasmataceae archaeon]|nr:ERAP1-like C-terminal domain-containing protein [Thermoplasmataceae archaeon]